MNHGKANPQKGLAILFGSNSLDFTTRRVYIRAPPSGSKPFAMKK
jgi:hypothetical protein